ncbi:MAG: ATP-binding protein [Bacteroidota bacterium]
MFNQTKITSLALFLLSFAHSTQGAQPGPGLMAQLLNHMQQMQEQQNQAFTDALKSALKATLSPSGDGLELNLSDNFKDKLRNVIRGDEDEDNGLGTLLNEEFKIATAGKNGDEDPIAKSAERTMDAFNEKMGKFRTDTLNDILGMKMVKRISLPMMLFSLLIVSAVVLYHTIKNWLLKPSLAIKMSSFFDTLHIKKFNAKQVLKEIKQALILNPEDLAEIEKALYRLETAFKHNLVKPTILIVGPPGTGKSELISILHKHLRHCHMSGSSFSQFNNGEEITQVTKVFTWAEPRFWNAYTPGLISIDEIEFLLQKRELQTAKNRGVFQAILPATGQGAKERVFIGATNNPSELDPAAMRRFHIVLALNPPDKKRKTKLLTTYFKEHLGKKPLQTKLRFDHAFFVQFVEKIEAIKKEATGADIKNIVNGLVAEALRLGKLTEAMITREIQTFEKSQKHSNQNYIHKK